MNSFDILSLVQAVVWVVGSVTMHPALSRLRFSLGRRNADKAAGGATGWEDRQGERQNKRYSALTIDSSLALGHALMRILKICATGKESRADVEVTMRWESLPMMEETQPRGGGVDKPCR